MVVQRPHYLNSFFEERYDYYSALKLGHSQKLRWFNKPLSWDLQLTWGFAQEGWSWLSEISVDLRKGIKTFLQADGIALAKTSDSIGGNRFLETYKRNDQVKLGVQIVF